MHRNGRKAAMPLRPLHMDADVAVLITRREATANMVALNVLLCWYNLLSMYANEHYSATREEFE